MFKINPIDKNYPLESLDVSAVLLIGFKNNKILAIKNRRGWDIPGGHVEKGETLREALIRETKEEASADLKKVIPFCYLSSKENKQVMVAYFSQDYELRKFRGFEDSFDRDELSVKEFLEIYFGDKKMIKRLIELGLETR